MLNRRKFLTVTAAGVGGVGTISAAAAATASDRGVRPAPATPTPERWTDNAVTLAWFGHATVLINFYGVRVLTDPVLFPRIGIDAWLATLGPLRLTSCALSPSELPDIDLVLVSHAHFDHLDTRSLASLPGRPAAITAWETSDLLPKRRFASVRELRWGESVCVSTARGDVDVKSIQVKHWGARLGRDTYRGYTGYVIRREGRAILFGGDTAFTPLFASHRGDGPYDAAIMPIGAYDPWIYNHCTPEQAVTMADAAGARLFVPVHHRTFALSREDFNEPINRARAALASEKGRLLIEDVGETAVLT